MSLALQPPALNASTPTLADWMELHSFYNARGRTSGADLIAIGQVEDDRESDDHIESDARLEALVDRVFLELDRRARAADGRYPFRVNQAGSSLLVREGDLNYGEYAYLFCLLVSEYRRQQMITSSIFAPVAAEVEDLFQLCGTIAAAGLLRGAAVSFGFPRPDGSGFLEALKRTFVDRMCEGQTEAAARPGVSSRTKDGGIDIVAWRDFPDGLPSKLYLLGQCASGAAYPSKGIRSFLSSFHGDWFLVQPGSPPIEALFIPFMLDHDVVPRRTESLAAARAGRYLSMARELGVILDRCRIACLVEDGAAMAHVKPSLVEGVSEFARVRSWVDRVSAAIRAAA